MSGRQRREESYNLLKSQADIKVADFDSNLAVIICHPWGPVGGNMDNNVVISMARYFHKLKITTLRLNFSGSQIGRGYGEVDEVVEAADFLLNGKPNQTITTTTTTTTASTSPSFILLVGYSYGSLIAASASAKISQVIGVVSIAPPFGVSHWLLCFNSSYHNKQARKRQNLHRLFLIGDRDNFTSTKTFLNHVNEPNYLARYTESKIFQNLDHFFFQKESFLVDEISQWFLNIFQLQTIKSLKNVDFSQFL